MNDNLNQGCILISRSILNSEIWKKPPEYLKIFLYILLKVNHKKELYPRGSNFFNFTEQKIDGVTRSQIYNFIRWAKSDKVAILTTQKTTRGVVLKVNNYDEYQTINNYYLQNTLQNSYKTATKQLQNSYKTINKNERMKECINLSLSNEEKQKKRKREREILNSYCKRNHVKNFNAYIRKLKETGDYQTILEEETMRLKKIEARKNAEKQAKKEEFLENSNSQQDLEKAIENAKNVVQMIRRRG